MTDKSKITSESELVKTLITSRDKLSIFKKIEISKQGRILTSLNKRSQQQILNGLSDEDIKDIVDELDPDEGTDILQEIDPRRAQEITQKLNDYHKEKIEFLLRFNPKAAAGIMSLDYIIVKKDDTFGEVLDHVLSHEKRTGKFPAILIVHENELKGELPGHLFALHNTKDKIAQYVKKLHSIKYDRNERKVINIFLKNPHNKIVVLGDKEEIIGIIHSDDVLRLMEKKSTHDLYGFAGVDKEEDILDGALVKVKYRYKWLIINLGTAFLAASVVGLFQDVISEFVLLAVYMPVVAGMGGNAGTQTLAVTIRGLVLKEIDLKSSWGVTVNEMKAGAINGLINGVIVASIATFINQSPRLGFVIGVAMIVNLVIAGFFGAFVPVVMKAIGKDPASSATIFITTATDVFGFFAFLGLAKIVL